MTPEQLRESVLRRFHERVQVGAPDECWEWTGHRHPNGYGRINSSASGYVYAHRIALELATQPEPDLHVCHTCDNPPCCNPAHLFWGTNDDNAADSRQKGTRKKATCRRGHVRTPENTYERIDKRGYLERHCRDCMAGRA